MRLDPPTEFQREIAGLLGLDISRDTVNVAAARLAQHLAPALLHEYGRTQLSPLQFARGQELGLDLTGESAIVAEERIQDAIYGRNREAIARMGLRADVRVQFRTTKAGRAGTGVQIEERVISKVTGNLRLLFEGMGDNGKWPTEVELAAAGGQGDAGAWPLEEKKVTG